MSSPPDTSVVLATSRSFDVDLMDRALSEPDCPVDDVVRVGSGFLLLRHLHAHETALVVLGLDLQGAEADLLEELGTQAPAVSVLLLVDPEDAAGVVLTDRDGEIVYANPAAERMLGLEEGTVVGRDCGDPRFDVRSPDGKPVAAEDRPVPRVLAGREAVQSATYVLGRVGADDVVVSIRAAPMGGEEGEPSGVVASIRDVTEEHRVREELGTARRLLDGVVESVPDALYAKDREGRYLMINSAGAGLFDMTVDEVVGLTDESLFTGEDAARIRDDDRRVMELGRAIRFREQARMHDGEERYFDVAKAPLRREDGSVAGVVGISRDVTERRKAERQLARSREKLQRYAVHITSARERERQQLARDIHDHLGQLLTVVKLKVSQLAGASRAEAEGGAGPGGLPGGGPADRPGGRRRPGPLDLAAPQRARPVRPRRRHPMAGRAVRGALRRRGRRRDRGGTSLPG